MNRHFLNPKARDGAAHPGLFAFNEYDRVGKFPAEPTPLVHLPGLALKADLADIMVKDESSRLGVNAFKILGVSYAVARLTSEGRLDKGSTLACASTGNHGRAVARVASEQGFEAKVYMPSDAAVARIKAIESEGGDVIVVDGNYDQALRLAVGDGERYGWTMISDAAWPSYEEIPRLIMTGYAKLMDEAARQWAPQPPPDVVLVQAGVGALAGAVMSWLCSRYGHERPFTIICEPLTAACFLESARAGKPMPVHGSLDTIMAGLAAGEVSSIAWPVINAAADAFVAIHDDSCRAVMRTLADPIDVDPAITAGASGACGLAVLLEILKDESLRPVRDASGLDSLSRVLVINTEGATDPKLYADVIGGEVKTR